MSCRLVQWLLLVFILTSLWSANSLPYRTRDSADGINDDPAERVRLSLPEKDAENGDLTLLSNLTDATSNLTTTLNTTNNSTVSTTSPSVNGLNVTTTANNSGILLNESSVAPQPTDSVVPISTLAVNGSVVSQTMLVTTKDVNATSFSVNVTLNQSEILNHSSENQSGLSNVTSTTNQANVTTTQLSSVTRNESKNASVSSNVTTPTYLNSTPSFRSDLNSVTTSLNTTITLPNSTVSTANSKPAQSNETGVTLSLGTNKSFTSYVTAGTSITSSIAASLSTGQSPTVLFSSNPTTPSAKDATTAPSSLTALYTLAVSIAPTTHLLTFNNTSIVPSSPAILTTPSAQSNSMVLSGQLLTVPTTHSSSWLPNVPGASVTQSTQDLSETSTADISTVPSAVPTSKETSTKSTSTEPSTAITITSTDVTSTGSSTKGISTAPTNELSSSNIPEEKTTAATKPPSSDATTDAAKTETNTHKTPPSTTKTTVTEKTEKETEAPKTTTDNKNVNGRKSNADEGKEAVLWDFIVPVGVGASVALAVAFGVIMVRTCRRRRLIKVRFGGKPSHPRLLNNDLINLLAESDDEEEE